jgi:hypothetical protein
VFHTDVAKVDRDVAHVAMVVHTCCKLLVSMFHLCFPEVCCKCVYLDVAYVFTHRVQSVLSGYCVFLQWFQVFLGAFVSVLCIKCFICFLTYVVFVASGCFKIRSSVASPSPFCCLASVSGVGRRRRSPLAWAGLTCLRAGAVDEIWAGRRGRGQRHGMSGR